MKSNYLFLILCSLLFVNCTKDVGTLNVTYFEANAIYGDLDKIRLQPVNSSVQEINNPGKIYVGENFILIGEEGKGIHVVDNTIASNPTTINFLNVPGNREFFVNGDFIYAESYYDVVKINISDLNNAQITSRVENVFASELTNESGETLLGFEFTQVTKEIDENSELYNQIRDNAMVYYDFARDIIPQSAVPASFAGNSNSTSGTVNRVTWHNDYVYIVGRDDVHVISDKSGLDLVTTLFNAGNEMETIFPYNDKLFVGSRASMEIFDISNPEQPRHDYRFDHATSCDPVLVKNEAAYISLRTAEFSPCPGNTNALIVLDIKNIEKPDEKDEIEMRSPYGMALINNHLYVGEGSNGLTVFDASNPLDLVEIKHEGAIEAYDVIQHPSRTDVILIAGPRGLDQYELTDQIGFEIESRINF